MSQGRKVYVVEDDAKISAVLADYLNNAGYSPQAFRDGGAALAAMRLETPDLVILDLMLPGMDGLTICRKIREFSAIPILMLTARIDETDRVTGLEAGADDYVCKPFSAQEVMARVAALIRRANGHVRTDAALTHLYVVDPYGQRIAWRGTWLTLSRSEYQILSVMMKHPGRIFTRAQLLDHISEEFRDVSDRTIDTHIKNIRRKIETVDTEAECIASVYGVGYRFDA